MTKPIYDYRSFRFSRLTAPEYRHFLLLLTWVVYFALYFLTENLIPPEKCTPIHWALDDLIPFHEAFVIPYTSWYALIVFSLLYFLLYDIDSFKKLEIYIFITQIVAMFIYIVFPSRQDLRPEFFERDNILTAVVGFLYGFDTSTGVCPSLHVAYSLGICSVWLKYKDSSLVWKIILVLWCILISISTAFVKQHSVADIFAALPLGLLAEILVFHVIKFSKTPLKKIPPEEYKKTKEKK